MEKTRDELKKLIGQIEQWESLPGEYPLDKVTPETIIAIVKSELWRITSESWENSK